jgi:hypothetical protein
MSQLREDDVVPLHATVPNYRRRLARLRDRKAKVDGKKVVEALLGEAEDEQFVNPFEPRQVEYDQFKKVWYEQPTLGLFLGPEELIKGGRHVVSKEAVEEVLNDFDQRFLAPKHLSYLSAFESGLVVFLGPQNGKVKLILSRKRKKVKLPARSRAWLRMLFNVDDTDRINISTDINEPYTPETDVILGEFLA